MNVLAYPNIDWNKFADDFVENELGLKRESCTTQISNYDNLCNLFNLIKTINNKESITIWENQGEIYGKLLN